MISVLLIAAGLCFTGQAPPVTTVPPQQTVTGKPLPWPGSDVESNQSARENGHKLLEAKSIYIQTALPPEESTPPTWLTQRWYVTKPDEADLRIFISKQVGGSVTIRRPWDNFQEAWNNALQRPPVQPAVWYKMMLVDHDGNWIMSALSTDSADAMWGDMWKQILDLQRWEAKQAKKAHKEKKKVTTQ